ncbi:MAG: alpha/beta hydrolase [Xanthomonadaceae bacterium]|nr:alpha/beta hydrolase [Xanthomonadaceae bacterium]
MSAVPKSRRPARAARRLVNLRDRLFDARQLVQSERTPYRLIHEDGIVRLRAYLPLPGVAVAHAVPVVLVAPLAVNMSIYDLFPERSLVADLLARGFRVYLIDWGRPGPAQDHWRLSTYITEWLPALLARVRAHAGHPALSLHGWSFGGLFAYAYTAWSGDPEIRNLVLVGAPCDYHDNGLLGQQYRRISRVVRRLGRLPALRPHATAPRWWRAPGWFNSVLYKLTAPVASLRPYLDLLAALDDRDKVAAHATNAAFLDDMVAYPGGVIQDVVQYLWTDNRLADGRLPMPGSDTRLSAITASLLLVAGRGDPIVTPACAKALLRLVASTDIRVLDVPGGHMAIVSGSQAPQAIWPEVGAWLAARSDSRAG